MAIDKKLIHFKSKDNFMSANGVNGNIDSPSSGSEENGNAEYGQVKGTSIAFVKDSKEIWTHGNLYKSVNWSTLGEDDNTTDGYHVELQDKTVEITENGQVEVSADAGYYGLNKVSINTEIKSQSKSVDVTSNGVTEVTPDSGYSYLTGVSVNVNVPQGGGGEELHSEYYSIDWAKGKELGYDEDSTNLSNIRMVIDPIVGMAIESVLILNGQSMVAPASTFMSLLKATNISRVKYIFPYTMTNNETGGLGEVTSLKELDGDDLKLVEWFIPITKEEFYNIG